MNLQEILTELEGYGDPQTKKIFTNHGCKEPFWGVKVEHLKKLQKKIKKDFELSLKLYETGNADAQYLACMITDPTKLTREIMNRWVNGARWYMLAEYPLAEAVANSPFGYELALEWLKADNEIVESAGWSTLSMMLTRTSSVPFSDEKAKEFVDYIKTHIHSAKNRVRSTMNVTLISIGTSCPGLTEYAIKSGIEIGTVSVDVGNTACKVPYSPDYIKKVLARKAKKS